jgi:hypothetical protein
MDNFTTVVGDALMCRGMVSRTKGRAEIGERPFVHDLVLIGQGASGSLQAASCGT